MPGAVLGAGYCEGQVRPPPATRSWGVYRGLWEEGRGAKLRSWKQMGCGVGRVSAAPGGDWRREGDKAGLWASGTI